MNMEKSRILKAFGVMKARSAANRAAVVDRRLDRQEEKSRRQDRGLDTRMGNVGMPVTYESARHDDPSPSVNIGENPKLVSTDDQEQIQWASASAAHDWAQNQDRPPRKKYGQIRSRQQRYMDDATKTAKRIIAPLAEARKTGAKRKVQTDKRTNRMLDRKLARRRKS